MALTIITGKDCLYRSREFESEESESVVENEKTSEKNRERNLARLSKDEQTPVTMKVVSSGERTTLRGTMATMEPNLAAITKGEA